MLYHQFNCLQDIKASSSAHSNIHEWLDKSSPNFNTWLVNNIFHYTLHTLKTTCFKICLAIPDMPDVAWRYAYHSQIILDRIFGVCDKKILLFIVMGIDKKERGVSLVFLLFSASGGNKFTATEYNTEILVRMISVWQDWQGKCNEKLFVVSVAITDTDLIECKALTKVFSRIWLLICHFHLCQAWQNYWNWCLKGSTPLLSAFIDKIMCLKINLLSTITLDDATTILSAECKFILQYSDTDPSTDAGINNALTHLKYLELYWIKPEFWKSWSLYK